MSENIKNLYTLIVHKFSQYSLSIVLISCWILIIHFFGDSLNNIIIEQNTLNFNYISIITMTLFGVHSLDKFLSSRIRMCETIKEQVTYYGFIIMMITVIILFILFADKTIEVIKYVKISYVFIFLSGFYSLNKLIFDHEIFKKSE